MIGKQLLEAFNELGSYHFLFWNCQIFAKILLKLVCQDSESIDFDALTSAEATRYVRYFGSSMLILGTLRNCHSKSDRNDSMVSRDAKDK